jgi:hypothetical protein
VLVGFLFFVFYFICVGIQVEDGVYQYGSSTLTALFLVYGFFCLIYFLFCIWATNVLDLRSIWNCGFNKYDSKNYVF